MFKTLRARMKQGSRTMRYPDGPAPALPDRFRGRPCIDAARCPRGCSGCAEVCPVGALSAEGGVKIDLGRCLFCGACAQACSRGAISFTADHRLAASSREELLWEAGSEARLARAFSKECRRVFGRSLKLREVSAGGCNACEADANVLTTLAWDLGRFGVGFVASPRHADGLLVTGPVSANMAEALKKSYEAIPAPKFVIACGSCAISGGPYAGHEEVKGGVGGILPVDLYIPGCPPHPLTTLDGILRLLGRIA